VTDHPPGKETDGVEHVTFERRPEMDSPVLVCAFTGWNDGGEAASAAAAYLRDRWGADRFARLDPEEFFDFQVTRPTVQLIDGVTRRIEWPANDFFHASLPDRDVVLFLGIEPNVRWRAFTEAILEVARELGTPSVVLLGGFLADVPHTLPTPVTGSAPDRELAERLGLSASRYEGPSGIVGVLHDAAGKSGLPTVSLWAAVPHYLPSGPNPKAALALVQKVAGFLDVDVATDTLERAARSWEAQVSEMIAQNEDLASYVRRLEESAADGEDLGEVPSGEALAAELERFLRDQRGDG
jgi:proteasome assembly chaperone (PAC2) family protein